MLAHIKIYEIIQICLILCYFKAQDIHKDKKMSNRLALIFSCPPYGDSSRDSIVCE